ncbi:Tolloid-like protein 2 [Clonorchis sinensis]|uniref:Tolloid-like protein 2 n=1 Tax=Clonorchis sinensis TaxID=79923 RepID=A0A3R7CVV1_CLOSI|nr:Tolloid-like protein 2 [Clonorchis sinensis]
MKVGAEAAVCESNYVSVFDVNDGTETELGRWCGAQGEELWLLSAGSSLLVRLHTDRVIDGDYFDANYVSTNCQFDVSEPNTQIISPPEGVVLNDQLRCLWRLQVPSNSEAHFHFREFNVQGSDHNCETNGLQLFSGTSGQLTHVDTFCGSETPSNATYKQKQLTLFLDTDEFNTDKTFQLAFSAIALKTRDSIHSRWVYGKYLIHVFLERFAQKYLTKALWKPTTAELSEMVNMCLDQEL